MISGVDAVTGDYDNVATVSGSFTDSAGDIDTATATDGSSYFGADPQINVVKEVWDGRLGRMPTTRPVR